MAILKNTGYQVKAEGSLVKMMLGNVPVTMDYNTALQIAQFLRISGRQAKANAGDRSFSIRSYGMLTDAEQDERNLQKLRDVTARFS